MNRKQFIFTLSVALLSGLMGGVLSIWLLLPQSVLVQDEPQKVITAEEFRVVDDEGNTLATLGESLTLTSKDGMREVRIHTDLLDFSGLLRIENQLPPPTHTLLLQPSAITLKNKGWMVTHLSAASLELYDSERQMRVALGTTLLKNPDTGFAEIGAPDSLVLLDEDGKVVWWAP